ncbi:hypothetical protein JKA74_07850 [Marivirga sp. S37H4]|uniref:Uncharacterized protein n=1 Tax=Marivirga aurantiaca TaxID=2802615 RepID=A0A934WY36_9BACT|nr:hypothetical protein [Marivirga aurantiaca]MBK6264946.1 hypothetical protein [Marivirga aurantiaca]
MRSSWILVSLINFLIAALMGLLLRFAFVWEIPWLDYRHMLHGHSHIAMLGWIYLALYAFFVDFFVPPDKQKKPFYSRLFWFTQLSVVGMMVSFPIQGYAAVSITFSTLHIIASYIFAWRIWKDLQIQNPQVLLLVKASLIFMLISTLGIWAMGPIMATDLRSSPLYLLAIQFYLHFQFNGWFALAVLALILRQFNNWNVHLSQKHFIRFFNLYVSGLLLTFFHVLDWAYQQEFLFLTNALGVVLQMAAIIYLFLPVRKQLLAAFKVQNSLTRALLLFGLFSWLAKVVFQLMLVFPDIAGISTVIRNFMIGYIHLTMLGLITGWLFVILFERIPQFKGKLGSAVFIIGFVATELILFLQGFFYWMGWGMLPAYHEVLAFMSVLLPLGLVFILLKGLLNQVQLKEAHIYT